MYDFVIIGANGIQGRIVSRDLLKSNFKVLLCDKDDYGLKDLIKYKSSDFLKIDLRNINKVEKIIKKSKTKIVINCALDDYNLIVTKLCLKLSVHYIDLGSTEEMTVKQLKLSKAFENKKLIGITGMGSTPGINNVMLRYIKPKFDTIETVHLGFAWKSNKAIFVPQFSLDSIAWEFTTKVKILEKGKFIYKKPNDCKINYLYKEIGKQKTFYTRHAEYVSFYKYLKKMGIKNLAVFSSFPEHSHKLFTSLIKLGFTDKKSINIDNKEIRPIDFSIEVLKRLSVPKGYKEKENIWLKVYGIKNGKKKFIEMDAIAKTLLGWEYATSNIDTGFPVSITGRMIKDGRINKYGMYAPEFIVPPLPFFAELGKKKIWIYENGKKINTPSMIKKYL